MMCRTDKSRYYIDVKFLSLCYYYNNILSSRLYVYIDNRACYLPITFAYVAAAVLAAAWQ